MLEMIRNMMKNEEGATAIEYGLIAALIAIVIIAGAAATGNSLDTLFQTVASTLAST